MQIHESEVDWEWQYQPWVYGAVTPTGLYDYDKGTQGDHLAGGDGRARNVCIQTIIMLNSDNYTY